VSTLGVVTGVGAGNNKTITATVDSGNKTATCSVTVADYCNSDTAFRTWLDNKPANNSSSVYTIKVNINNPGNFAYALKANGKYVNLDLSDSTFTRIVDGAFRGCATLTGITIPACVTKIGGEAFKGCTSLASVTFKGDNTELNSKGLFGKYSFFGNLDKVYKSGGAGTYKTDTPAGDYSVWTKQP
jgi:hypothetical protein